MRNRDGLIRDGYIRINIRKVGSVMTARRNC